MELQVRNVNDAFSKMLPKMIAPAYLEETRNGLAYVYPQPVLTIYQRPWERVLWSAQRNANPFFHIMEAFWALAGRQDVGFLCNFNKRMQDYSDDGINLYGAYGYRWHYAFEFNQLEEIVQILRKDPTSRQAVLTMWSPTDLVYETEDKPCNTHIYFRIKDSCLDMTVCCRSNDMLWGAYGTNSVLFSFLHEYVASAISAGRQGWLYQFSNNFHLYKDTSAHLMGGDLDVTDFYIDPPYVQAMKLVNDPFVFLHEVRSLLYAIEKRNWLAEFHNEFLYTPLLMAEAWFSRHNDPEELWQIIGKIPAQDWQLAAQNYLERNVCTKNLRRG